MKTQEIKTRPDSYYWYCPFCKCEVEGRNVTNNELHNTCGYRVETRDNNPKTTGQEIITKLIEKYEAKFKEYALDRDTLQSTDYEYAYLLGRQTSTQLFLTDLKELQNTL